MDNKTIITRRAALTMLLIVAASATPPASAAAFDPDSEFHALFAAWRIAYDLANYNSDDGECEKLWAIEDQMAGMRPVTAVGFAIKLLVMTSYDEFDLDSDRAKTLFRDAEAMTALPPPTSILRTNYAQTGSTCWPKAGA